jgi:hypothetical protein
MGAPHKAPRSTLGAGAAGRLMGAPHKAARSTLGAGAAGRLMGAPHKAARSTLGAGAAGRLMGAPPTDWGAVHPFGLCMRCPENSGHLSLRVFSAQFWSLAARCRAAPADGLLSPSRSSLSVTVVNEPGLFKLCRS